MCSPGANFTDLICAFYTPSEASPIKSVTFAWFLLGFLNELFTLKSDETAEMWIVPNYDLELDGVLVGNLTVSEYQLAPAESRVAAVKGEVQPEIQALDLNPEWTVHYTGNQIPLRTFLRLSVNLFVRFIFQVDQEATVESVWTNKTVHTGRDPSTGASLSVTFAELASDFRQVAALTGSLTHNYFINTVGASQAKWETFKASMWSRKLQRNYLTMSLYIAPAAEGSGTSSEEEGLGAAAVLPVTHREGNALRVVSEGDGSPAIL